MLQLQENKMTLALTTAEANLDTTRDEAELDRLLAKGRAFSAEFPLYLANHLPMMLVALHRLNASDERLAQYFSTYAEAHHLEPPQCSISPIIPEDWTNALGDRDRETDYRNFFAGEIDRLGIERVIAAYLPRLLPGLAASATHGLMRFAYGVLRWDAQEIATALGYWAATFLLLGEATGAPPITEDPAEVLGRLRRIPAFRGIKPELDLLWHFMRAMSRESEFVSVVDWLAIGPGSLKRVAETSLALYAGTMDFCALHAVTGSHWLRIISPVTPEPNIALRYFWQAIAALYPKIGFPDLPSPETLDGWRKAPVPSWPKITATACRSEDEHDISLTFSAWEEWKFYGDPLYRFVAARRLGLIA
jgi:Questin oxidase-like